MLNMKDLSNEPDYTILDLILAGKEPYSRRAFGVFHQRYASYMMGVAKDRTYRSFPNQWMQAAEDIVQNAFIKVMDGLPKFKKTPDLSPEAQKKHLKTWLYRIVENAFVDYYKAYYYEGLGIEEMNEIGKLVVLAAATTETQTRSLSKASRERHDQILEAIKSLSEKEVLVLRAYAHYGKIDNNDFWVLEPEVLENLSKKIGVKQNSIQQIKKRTIEKLREILNRQS